MMMLPAQNRCVCVFAAALVSRPSCLSGCCDMTDQHVFWFLSACYWVVFPLLLGVLSVVHPAPNIVEQTDRPLLRLAGLCYFISFFSAARFVEHPEKNLRYLALRNIRMYPVILDGDRV